MGQVRTSTRRYNLARRRAGCVPSGQSNGEAAGGQLPKETPETTERRQQLIVARGDLSGCGPGIDQTF